jgi:DNA repair protein RadC
MGIMTTTDWPINEQPHEKLLYQGSNTLTDAELLAILLRKSSKDKTAFIAARELLERFGSLHKLFHASIAGNGLSKANYIQFQAQMEIQRRLLLTELSQRNVLNNLLTVKKYLKSLLSHESQETFVCLFLNSKNHLLSAEKLFVGTVNKTHVYPREVVKRALLLNAVNIICSHNHPSGNPAPSAADRQLTLQLHAALELVEIKLLDHIIVAEQRTVSFAECGLL